MDLVFLYFVEVVVKVPEGRVLVVVIGIEVFADLRVLCGVASVGAFFVPPALFFFCLDSKSTHSQLSLEKINVDHIT